MNLSSFRFTRSFAISSTAVSAVVAICFGTLLMLRPWPQTRTAETITPAADLSRRDDELRARAYNEPTTRADRLPEPLAPDPAAPAGDAGQSMAAMVPAPADVPADPAAKPETAPPVTTAATPKLAGALLTKAEVDDALRPLLNYELSGDDLKNLKEAVRLIQRDEFSAARPVITKIGDSGAQKFALWYFYRSGAYDASADEVAAFRETSPLWPDRDNLEDRVEEALLWRESSPKKILAYFAERRPTSGAGKAALGGAMLTSGRGDEGRALIRSAWREHYLTPAIETKMKDAFAEVLRQEDHKARLDWLLVKNRKSDLKTIERMVPLVDKKWEKAIQAQISLIKGDKAAGAALDKLEGGLKDDPAVVLARITAARRADKDEQVWDLLRAAPADPAKLINPLSWWEYRETQIRLALNSGQTKTAYELAKGFTGDLPAEDLSDANFLAGWIALRFMNDARTAQKYLTAAVAAGGLPKHRARANYWLGRAELALDNKRGATARFVEAAQFTHTFYGQLARQATEAKTVQFTMRPYARPSKADIRAFTRDPVIMALAAANKAGFEGLVAGYLDDLARQITSAPDMTLACELSSRITGAHRAVRMAKIAMNRGFPVEQYAYPDVLPQFKMLADSDSLEEPLIHALTRQESEFNPKIVSSAGAMGLMQLLPATAKEVARAHDIKFEKQKLMSDPSYNLALGSAFLHRLIRSYNGSYIMALAAYNAGPGRVRQWVAQFGDPRDKKVDPIDWIERIPFYETREYVLKIMESAQVYRARLKRDGDTLRLAQDLNRGRAEGARVILEAGMH